MRACWKSFDAGLNFGQRQRAKRFTSAGGRGKPGEALTHEILGGGGSSDEPEGFLVCSRYSLLVVGVCLGFLTALRAVCGSLSEDP